MNTKKFIFLSVALTGFTVASQAQVISDWTFETTAPAGTAVAGASFGAYAPEVGNGTASALHAGAATYSSPAGNGSAKSFSVNTWAVNDYFQFQLSTVGFTGLAVSYDQNGSGTGPAKFEIAYSIDGSTFTPIGSTYTLPAGVTWAAGAANPLGNTSFFDNLSSITAIDNNPTVYFRIIDEATTSISGGTVGTAGTGRVDNFTVEVAPEPSTFALLGLGAGALAFIRRRK